MLDQTFTILIGPAPVTVRTDSKWISEYIEKHLSEYISRESAGMMLDITGCGDRLSDEDVSISIQQHSDKLSAVRGDFTAEFDIDGNSGTVRVQDGSILGLTTSLKIAFTLSALNYDGFFIHTAAALYEEKGMIFPGQSGAGKTTLIKKLRDYEIVTDEFALIALSNNQWKVYSTPFRGELSHSDKLLSAPLENIMFLDRNNESGLNRISSADSLHRLIQNIVGWGYSGRGDTLMSLAHDLVKSVDSFTLSYSLNDDPNEIIAHNENIPNKG